MASDSRDTLQLCLSPIGVVLLVGLCAQGILTWAQPTAGEVLRDLPEAAVDGLLPEESEATPSMR